MRSGRWVAFAPGLFVVLWSTGFIGAKLGLAYAEPLTFLLLRFIIVAALMLPVLLLVRAPWPGSAEEVAHIAIAGLLLHAGYLAGVYVAIEQGVPAGMVALIAGLQPLLTSAVALPLLGEKVNRRQWLGLFLGLVGVAFVVGDRLAPAGANGAGFAFLALLSFTAGTLYQKRYCGKMDLGTGSFIQFTASMVVLSILAPLFENLRVEWNGEFLFALAWLVLVLSLGAISLLLLLIRAGEAFRVASLFYLVPPVTALIAFAAFGEQLGGPALLGMLISAAGVALVTGRAIAAPASR
jgi:drug/metabolite transporter (DMT)-like permease